MSTAAIVTAGVAALCVSPAAIVSVVPACVKSLAVAGDTAWLLTVTVVAALDAPLSRAVTADSPPASSIDDAESNRLTTGVASSSSIVSVTSTASFNAASLSTVPVTVT